MSSIIVAMPRQEDAKKISEILQSRGLETAALCTTASQVLARVHELDAGVVICGRCFRDMHYSRLAEYLPEYFTMVLLCSNPVPDGREGNVVIVQMPFRAGDLTGTVEMLLAHLRKRLKKKAPPTRRSQADRKDIEEAKKVLMERNHMTEPEAFRYIQKCSMDSGTNMVETAQMILMLEG